MVLEAACSMTNDPIISIQNLRWHVGGIDILNGIDLDVIAHETLCIIGPNGAGKSSLLNVISGVNNASSGKIFLKKVDATHRSRRGLVLAGLARSFQTSSMFDGLTAFDNIVVAARSCSTSWLDFIRPPEANSRLVSAANEALRDVGLLDKRDVVVSELAHGDKRKLELALLICSGADVLLLDEPTAGLSSGDLTWFVDLIRMLKDRRITIVLVEHRIGLVLDIASRVAVLAAGKVLAVGQPSAIVSDASVREAYLGRSSSSGA
jgi:branched-chain amino acid transport system ATP-binding protein